MESLNVEVYNVGKIIQGKLIFSILKTAHRNCKQAYLDRHQGKPLLVEIPAFDYSVAGRTC